MAKDGWWFVGPALAVALLGAVALRAGWRGGWVLWIGGLILTGCLTFFFRDPDRRAPDDPNVVVAPADGAVLAVASLPDGGAQIDIFLSIFDVHVNRAPVGGKVISSEYHPGKFLAAYRDDAGTRNERQDVTIQSQMGIVRYAQVAGVLARRIVCTVHEGDSVKAGQRVGLIRFGSRAQVILPPGVTPTVHAREHVKAGETVIARLGVPKGGA